MDAYRQFFDTASSTFTYLLVDLATRDAVIIDPVDTHLDEYLDVIAREELTLAYVLETHAHADHITSAGKLCQSTGAKAAAPVHCAILPADIQLEDGAELRFGGECRRVARECLRGAEVARLRGEADGVSKQVFDLVERESEILGALDEAYDPHRVIGKLAVPGCASRRAGQ